MNKKTYYDEEETKPKREIHKNERGQWHRLDGPARQGWHESGQKYFESWLQEGLHHRLDGPAYQSWCENGQEETTTWDIFGVMVAKDVS